MQRMKLQIWWRKKIKTKKKIRASLYIQISYILCYDPVYPERDLPPT